MKQINIMEIIHLYSFIYSTIFIHLFNYMEQINIVEIFIYIHSSIQQDETNKHYKNYSSIFIHLFNYIHSSIYSIIYSIAEFMNKTLGSIASILPLGVAAAEEESIGRSRVAAAEEEEAGMRTW
jgi:hypothetical protein